MLIALEALLTLTLLAAYGSLGLVLYHLLASIWS